MSQQLYASLSTPIKQQILAKRFETHLRENLSGYKPDVKNKQIATMIYSKAEVLNCGNYYNKVVESAYSPEDAKLLKLYMSKICNHDVSLVLNEKWDDHIHPAIALNLVETCKVPDGLNTEKICIIVIEFAPVFPQFKLTASYFEKFSNLASLSLYEYSFNDVDVVSMFSQITFLQFLFLKYCDIEDRLQEILDSCFILQTIRLIHCSFSCKDPIVFPRQMQKIGIRQPEALKIDISRCENNLKELALDTNIYHIEIITSKSSNTKIITSESSNIKIITPQSSNTKIITSQNPNLRELDLRCYLIDPRCFGESLKFIKNLTLDWDAIYNYATIGSSSTKNLQDKSRHLDLEYLICLDMFCVIHPSSEYNLTCTFTTAMEEGHFIKAILKWEHQGIQRLRFQLYPITFIQNHPRYLVGSRF